MKLLTRSTASGLVFLFLALAFVPRARASTGPAGERGDTSDVRFSLAIGETVGASGTSARVPAGTPSLFSPALFPSSSNASSAYDIGSGPRRHKTRAWLELGGFVAYSGISYWIKYTKKGFIEDWQFQLNWHDQSRRFFTLQAWRFDSNNFSLNWTHALAGGIYYNFFRTNNFSWLQSLAAGVGTSFFWEYVVEWKEVVSINDQIMTGLGSYATGETFYQIGHYLAHQPGFFHQVLSLLNPVVKFNHWWDRKDPAAHDYVQPGWHDFRFFAGARSLTSAGREPETGLYFGVRAALLTPPGYGQPGEVRERLKDTYFSEFYLDYAVRGGRADETNLVMTAMTLGSFRQSIDASGRGHALIFGIGSSFDYFKKRPVDVYDYDPVPVNQGIDLHLERPRNFTDKLAILHIAGPVLDWTVFRPGLKLRTVVAAFGDFSLTNSLALNTYSGLHDIAGEKTTVLYYGYYYGFGGTVLGSATLDWGGLRARARADFGAWSSADGLDRFPELVTNNAHLGDNRFRYLVGLGYKVPRLPFEVFVNYEDLHRWGRIQEVRVTSLEKRAYAGLSFLF